MKLTLQDDTLHITIEKTCDSDTLLAYFQLSRKTRYAYYQERRIFADGKALMQNHPLAIGTHVQIQMQAIIDTIPAYDIPLDIVYEDDLFLMVNKPVGMLVHSDGTNTTKTLNNIVQAYYQKQQVSCPVRPLHRLDVETSGIVIYCKLPFFQPLCDDLLKRKEISRIYLALVQGNLPKKEYIIKQPLARDRHDARKMRISKQGSDAWTKVIRKKSGDSYSLVECHLRTGRTHQIRVHLASIGYPILSDALYGTPSKQIQRCALHAWKIKLYHPLLQSKLEVVCEMPEDMLQVVKAS